jgi:hypothetical protein
MGIAYGLAHKELQDVEKNAGMIVLREKNKNRDNKKFI